MYGVGKAVNGQGDPEDEFFLIPLHLNHRMPDILKTIPNIYFPPRAVAMFLLIRQRVLTESQASQPSTGDASWLDHNSWWWPQQPVLTDELERVIAQQTVPFDPQKELQNYAATHFEEEWYVPPKDLNPSAFAGSA